MSWWRTTCISRIIKALGNMIDAWLLVLITSFISAVGGLSVLLIQGWHGERSEMFGRAETDDPSIAPASSLPSTPQIISTTAFTSYARSPRFSHLIASLLPGTGDVESMLPHMDCGARRILGRRRLVVAGPSLSSIKLPTIEPSR